MKYELNSCVPQDVPALRGMQNRILYTKHPYKLKAKFSPIGDF
jgi:hypothetical protein